MADELSVNEKMARWHDWHAEQFPEGHSYRTMHERVAAELRSGRPPVRARPRFCWHRQRLALLVWAEWIDFPAPGSIRFITRPSDLQGIDGVLLMIEGHPDPVPAEVMQVAERLGYRIVRLDDTLARRRHAALARRAC